MANLKIKLVKSLNGRLEKHIATAESLGLRKIGQVVCLRQRWYCLPTIPILNL